MVGLALAAMVTLAATDVAIAQGGSIYQATLAEPNQKTPEVSTEEVRRIQPTAAPSSWIPGAARNSWSATFRARGTLTLRRPSLSPRSSVW